MRKKLLITVLVGAACSHEPGERMSSQAAPEAPTEEALMPASPPMSAAKVEATGGGGSVRERAAAEAEPLLQGALGHESGGALADRLAAGVLVASKRERDEPAVVTRSWFPETFLFEPLIVTDEAGKATLSVRVPDRLTSYRVLALAHSRAGAQGGALTSFLGTLPVYVDPVVPDTLMLGDEVMVPIQIVNTTDAPISTTLTVEATHARIESPRGTRTVQAGATVVEYLKLRTERAGQAVLRATLGDTDAIVKTIRVLPTGRPVRTEKSGTLAAPRTIKLAGMPESDPAHDTVRLQAFPGAISLFRSELGVALSRTSAADDAYALLLAGRASALLENLGDVEVSQEAIREVALTATQRAIRDARTLDLSSATLLTQAALAHPDNPVLERLGERAADYLARSQLPDGTFKTFQGDTLQRMLVSTADAVRAVNSAQQSVTGEKRAKALSARARGAFERNAIHVEDGYTAAVILASGATSGSLAADLRTKLLSSLKPAPEGGAMLLPVPQGVLRADGRTPSEVEATAMAVLALSDDTKAPLADLGSTLLGSYAPGHGWGDGRTNLVAMQAVLTLFREPVAHDIRITLAMDGKPVLEGLLERNKLHHELTLEAQVSGLAQEHAWTLTAEPPVPGLAYTLTLEGRVPWQDQPMQEGVEIAVPEQIKARVGVATPISVQAAVPLNHEAAERSITFVHTLPCGVQPDEQSLKALVSSGALQSFSVTDGSVRMVAENLESGKLFSVTYRAVPTLAGTLHTAASELSVQGETHYAPPATWQVEPANARKGRAQQLAAAGP